jgi:hypothetical protein
MPQASGAVHDRWRRRCRPNSSSGRLARRVASRASPLGAWSCTSAPRTKPASSASRTTRPVRFPLELLAMEFPAVSKIGYGSGNEIMSSCCAHTWCSKARCRAGTARPPEQGGCMADHAEIDMLKNVREGLRLARRDELETERVSAGF